MAMLWFYCDESYDSKGRHPKTYAVGGFLCELDLWQKIEKAWIAKNERVGVPRFHASHLNALEHEFEGWTKQRSKRYVKDLVKILSRPKKKLHGISWAVLNDEYRDSLNDSAREKLGDPYIVCFKACISSLAHKIDEAGLPPHYKFSVIFEQNHCIGDTVEVFQALKDNPAFSSRARLGTCAPGERDENKMLQPADLIAYESYRRVHKARYSSDAEFSKVMQKMLPVNGFSGGVMGKPFFEKVKAEVESASCARNGFFFY